jgi:hypothetical protein
MSILDVHLEKLRESPSCANADLARNPDGSAVVTVPAVPLPQGWSKAAVTVKFVAPVGYPHAKPDCFWADADLTLLGGGQPQASNMTPIPGSAQPLRWFSWHISHWDPNRDSFFTYVNVIRERFKDCR